MFNRYIEHLSPLVLNDDFLSLQVLREYFIALSVCRTHTHTHTYSHSPHILFSHKHGRVLSGDCVVEKSTSQCKSTFSRGDAKAVCVKRALEFVGINRGDKIDCRRGCVHFRCTGLVVSVQVYRWVTASGPVKRAAGPFFGATWGGPPRPAAVAIVQPQKMEHEKQNTATGQLWSQVTWTISLMPSIL